MAKSKSRSKSTYKSIKRKRQRAEIKEASLERKKLLQEKISAEGNYQPDFNDFISGLLLSSINEMEHPKEGIMKLYNSLVDKTEELGWEKIKKEIIDYSINQYSQLLEQALQVPVDKEIFHNNFEEWMSKALKTSPTKIGKIFEETSQIFEESVLEKLFPTEPLQTLSKVMDLAEEMVSFYENPKGLQFAQELQQRYPNLFPLNITIKNVKTTLEKNLRLLRISRKMVEEAKKEEKIISTKELQEFEAFETLLTRLEDLFTRFKNIQFS